MSWSYCTLVILKENVPPKDYLFNFHRSLDSIGLQLEVDEYSLITFNDLVSDAEKDVVDLNKNMSQQDVIEQLCSWDGLGSLGYRHPNFRLPIIITYLSWDEQHLQGFIVSFSGKEKLTKPLHKLQDELVQEIVSFTNYDMVLCDIDDVADSLYYPSYTNDLEKVKAELEKLDFQIKLKN